MKNMKRNQNQTTEINQKNLKKPSLNSKKTQLVSQKTQETQKFRLNGKFPIGGRSLMTLFAVMAC
jgi:hypothetical protein